jgi:alpha-tubulin suppressor-like RCC1 family protein
MPVGPNLHSGQTLVKPTKMSSGEIPPNETLTSIGVGINGGCLLANGDAYCWSTGGLPRLVGPGDLAANVKLTSLSVTDDITCALGDDGKAYCFGKAFGRRFGAGSAAFTETTAWKLVAQGEIPGGARITQLAVGGTAAASCVIANDHKAYCWGLNHQGVIGIGNSREFDVLEPRHVAQGGIPADVGLLKVVCGQYHCAALGDDGRIYAWGENQGLALAREAQESMESAPVLINAPIL